MNLIVLKGNPTEKPVLRYCNNKDQTPVVNFTLAVNRKKANEGEQSADFFTIVAYGARAEFCEKYLDTKSRVIVTGEVVTGSYTDKEGVRRSSFKVQASDIEFA